jgi:hypothetical protein
VRLSSKQGGLLFTALALAFGPGCATTNWADEPGKAVPVSLAANTEAGDQFLNKLTAARSAHGLGAPIVTPSYQTEVRNFADDLQSGKTSAPGAQRAITAWGRYTFQNRVDAWAIDCGSQAADLPSELVKVQTAFISYAAAYFRPQSSASDQCAVLVIAPQPH